MLIRILIIFVTFLCLVHDARAEPVKLRTLKGDLVEGELADIDDKLIVLNGKTGSVATPLQDVLDVTLRSDAPPTSKYVDVALTDGCLLHCTRYSLQNKETTLQLVTGQEIKLPLSAIAYILDNAQEIDVRAEWQRLLGKQGNRDLLAIRKNNVLNSLEGTFGESDDKGESIEFELNGGKKAPIRLDRIHGMSFFRKLDATLDQPLCKVIDVKGNVLIAKSITKTKDHCTVVTIRDMKITMPLESLARLDFSKGKLAFLSDLEPIKKVEQSALEVIDHYRRDKNLDGESISIAGKVYPKGLAIHAYTELVYDIGGEYKEFKCLLGIDDQVGGDVNVKVTIEGDGRELLATEVRRKDNKPIPVAVDVRNVKQLRIVVASVNLFDLGDHITLADAKVNK